MASLTDGLGQSIISRLAQPPDVTTGESGIPALFGGLSSGFQAGRQFVKDRRGFKAAKDEMSAMVGGKGISTRDAKAAGLVKPSFLEAFAGGMTRTPGVRAAGRDPNFSINQKIAEQNLRMNELQIQELIEQRENRVSTRETSLDLGRFIANGIRSGVSNSPEFRASLAETLARNPESLTDPRIVQQLRLLQQSQTIEQENEKLRRVPDIAPGFVPSRQTVETPTGTITLEPPPPAPAAPIPGFTPSQQTITGPTGSVTLKPPPPPPLTPEQAAALGLEPSRSANSAELIYERPRSGESLSIITPDGVQVLQQSGPGANANVPTVATRSRSQEDIVNAQKVINDLDQFESGLKAEHLGIKGVLTEEIFDRLLPQFGIDKSDPARIDTRSNLRLLVQGAMRQINIESRFSDADRKAVERALPSPGMRETLPRAKQMTAAVRRTMAKRALIDAQAAGIAPPQFAIRALTNDALLDAFNQGLISLEIALAETERREKLEAK